MASERQRGEPSTASLLSSLRWIAIGLVALQSPVSLVVGWFDPLLLLGLLLIVWAAHVARAGSSSPRARLLWAATIVACGATALGSVNPSAAAWVALSNIGQLVGMNTMAWAMVATTRGCRLDIAQRWMALARVLGPLSFAAAAGAVLAWNVGSPVEQGVGGAFLSVGEIRLSLPGWAWPIVVTSMLGLAVAAVWGVVLGFLTYQQANAAEASRTGSPASGTPLGRDGR